MTAPSRPKGEAARIAGLAYVFGILNVPAYLLTSAGLTVANELAATIANVQANPVHFRVGTLSTLVMFVSVFVFIAALYVTAEPINRNRALLGLVLRLPKATFGLVTLVFSLLVSQLASGDASWAEFGPQQVQGGGPRGYARSKKARLATFSPSQQARAYSSLDPREEGEEEDDPVTRNLEKDVGIGYRGRTRILASQLCNLPDSCRSGV